MIIAPAIARADEGMWLPNAFPSERVAQKYGFTPDQAWLDDVRLASARLAQGCSASFVSPQGLVMTNHHCAHTCIEQLSSPQKDLIADGFYARSEAEERRCPDLEVDQLVSIEDVSKAISDAVAGKTGAAFFEAKKVAQSKLEKTCATSDDLRCDVVELYHGARFHLYRYRRYQDVRLVFAPEFASAFFGGDPDNFNFPRYDLDLSFVRVYSDGKPLRSDHYFPFSPSGAAENELTFVSGNPGKTSRELTVSELLFERSERLPKRLFRLSELRGLLTEFAERGKEQRRISGPLLFYTENSLKALEGRLQALLDGELIKQRREQERTLRARMAQDKRPNFASAWQTIDRAVRDYREIYDSYDMLEHGVGFDCTMFDIARDLVRASDELPKPNETRLREYSDSALPQLKQALFSSAPIHPDLEILRLSFALTKLRERLGPDDPAVRKVLGTKSPARLAAELIAGSKLANVALRKQLFEGGKAAVDASRDPLIELARLIDSDARAVRKRSEDTIESAMNQGHEAIAAARFEAFGTSVYPDATFTLRYSYGAARGWQERGRQIAPFTTMRGAFDRHTGEAPFALPKSWLKVKDRLALDTPLNFVTTNDIIGGNSGSPVINKSKQIVGLVFDGNIDSLGGEYGFDERSNRAVAVHSSAILEALRVIYGAGRIADELRGATQNGSASPARATP